MRFNTLKKQLIHSPGKHTLMDNRKLIGVDIGATKIHVGLVEAGNVLHQLLFPTPAGAPKEQIIEEVKKDIEELMDREVAGIGVGVAGLVDEEKGVVYDVQNIPSWQEVALQMHLESAFKIPVSISNDANTFVLGEKMYGEGQKFKNLLGITLGTGLGAGIVINDLLYSGLFSSAGELGGIPYLDKTMEDYCSGKFFLHKFGMEGSRVFEQARAGDPHALNIYKQYGAHLGNLINTVLFAYSPEAIFLGGSISKCFPFFKASMFERIEAFPFKRVSQQLVLQPSVMDNAAILGAAALVGMKNRRTGPSLLEKDSVEEKLLP
jgi:glucokinase